MHRALRHLRASATDARHARQGRRASTRREPTWAKADEGVWCYGLDAAALAATTARARSKGLFRDAAFVHPKTLNYELPTRGAPEIAIAGRSNVGKSTLVGALLGDRKLARTSKTPGCTTSVNFFSVGGRAGTRRRGAFEMRCTVFGADRTAAAGRDVDIPRGNGTNATDDQEDELYWMVWTRSRRNSAERPHSRAVEIRGRAGPGPRCPRATSSCRRRRATRLYSSRT
mmetsp:Transcript_14856/g.44302  ORF Transcript_14856/g.44302 Transcript_14856/m.44302 type:complete len:229 (-) Transcript_14856:495-1181(-)